MTVNIAHREKHKCIVNSLFLTGSSLTKSCQETAADCQQSVLSGLHISNINRTKGQHVAVSNHINLLIKEKAGRSKAPYNKDSITKLISKLDILHNEQ